jgi:glycosyltransferase involved in cell wall biosynthesis
MTEGKINVLLFKNSFQVGGAEKQLVLLANHLHRQKYRVFVLAFETEDRLLETLATDVVFCKVPRRKILGGIMFLRSFIKSHAIDICHTWDFRSSIVGFGACRLVGRPSPRFIDGSLRSAPTREIFARMFSFRVQKWKVQMFARLKIPILSNSLAGLIGYGVENYPGAGVIYNGFEFQSGRLSEEMDLSGDFRVCMVAHMRWKKDFMTFIKAGLKVLEARPQVTFFLIGDGPDRVQYERFLKGNRFEEHFVFTGFVAHPERLIRQMDVGVLCNDTTGEGLSNSIMEYMAAKKPVIATHLGGNPELVDDGGSGFLIPEKDYLVLAEKIEFLMDHPDTRYRMGERGYQRLSRLCGIDIAIGRYDRYYSDLLGRPGEEAP